MIWLDLSHHKSIPCLKWPWHGPLKADCTSNKSQKKLIILQSKLSEHIISLKKGTVWLVLSTISNKTINFHSVHSIVICTLWINWCFVSSFLNGFRPCLHRNTVFLKFVVFKTCLINIPTFIQMSSSTQKQQKWAKTL